MSSFVPKNQRYDTDDYVPSSRHKGQRPVDYFSSAIYHVQNRFLNQNSPFAYTATPPHLYYSAFLLPSRVTSENPSSAVCTRWMHTSEIPAEKRSGSRFFSSICWSPDSRYLLCATSMGEFFVLNGHNFARERFTTAHVGGRAIRQVQWNSNLRLITSCDDAGLLRLWTENLELAAEASTGQKDVREVSCSPNPNFATIKLVTAGHDGSARLWGIENAQGKLIEEIRFEGHGSEVTTAQWHPTNALIATGSKDSNVRLWDPRSGAGSIATLESHAAGVSCVRWHPDGGLLLTASADCTTRLWDLRKVKEEMSFQAHQREVTKIDWHPHHKDLFASSSSDGDILYWVYTPGEGHRRADGVCEVLKEFAAVRTAHDKYKDKVNEVKGIAWAPMGHLLASHNYDVKLWHRNKPGFIEMNERGNELEN